MACCFVQLSPHWCAQITPAARHYNYTCEHIVNFVGCAVALSSGLVLELRLEPAKQARNYRFRCVCVCVINRSHMEVNILSECAHFCYRTRTHSRTHELMVEHTCRVAWCTHFFCTPACRCPFLCQTCSRTLRFGTPHSQAQWSHGIQPTLSMFSPKLHTHLECIPESAINNSDQWRQIYVVHLPCFLLHLPLLN